MKEKKQHETQKHDFYIVFLLHSTPSQVRSQQQLAKPAVERLKVAQIDLSPLRHLNNVFLLTMACIY